MQKYKQNFAVDASDAAKLKTRVEEGSAVPVTEEEEEENDAYIELPSEVLPLLPPLSICLAPLLLWLTLPGNLRPLGVPVQ